MDTFRSGGPGGQNQNVRDTGVRFTHHASGAVGESREHRYQWQNKKTAWKRMAEHPKFKIWVTTIAALEEVEKASSRRYTYKGKDISLETRKKDRD
jgi:protein subunit release factor B